MCDNLCDHFESSSLNIALHMHGEGTPGEYLKILKFNLLDKLFKFTQQMFKNKNAATGISHYYLSYTYTEIHILLSLVYHF